MLIVHVKRESLLTTFRYILSVHITELRDITELYVQRNDHLDSLVIHIEKQNKILQPARDIIRKVIYSTSNSKDGINLSWDTPLNN